MATYEEEYRRIEKSVLRIARLMIFPKKIELRGDENFVRTGANIITGNHIGSYKDVAVLLLTKPKMLYFTANKMIFNRAEANELVSRHLHRHMGNFGGFVHLILKPFYSYMVDFVSGHIAKIGAIPVDMYGRKTDTIRQCQDYLRKERTIIALQGRGRVLPTDPNPYVKSFRRGVSIMVYDLYREEGLSVPVTPLSIFGTHIMWGVPGRIRVNVGPPLFVKDYWGGGEADVVARFRDALEKSVSRLFLDSLKW